MLSIRHLVLGTIAAAGLCLTSLPVHAAVVFQPGNNPQTDENVLLMDSTVGPLVHGVTNQSNQVVAFSSTTDILTEPSNGQARIEAQDGALNNLMITTPGNTYTSLIVNAFNGTGTLNISVMSNMGNYFFPLVLGNGSNSLTLTTVGGETIVKTTFDAPGGFPDLRQIRIGGIAPNDTPPPSAVPEPASMALLGMGALPLLRRLRRRPAQS
jgi:MYXO-CTERM domain-containing protein